MSRIYPDERSGPFDPPPQSFTDRADRTVRIERYDGRDEQFEEMVEMYLDFDAEDRAQGIPPAREDGIRDWLGHILAEDCVNVVARTDGRVVGHATLVPDARDEEQDTPYELAIFVLHDYQEAGIGTGLITGLLGAGEREGIERVWLTVERWNSAAQALYRKVGFEPSKTDSFELEMAIRLTPGE